MSTGLQTSWPLAGKLQFGGGERVGERLIAGRCSDRDLEHEPKGLACERQLSGSAGTLREPARFGTAGLGQQNIEAGGSHPGDSVRLAHRRPKQLGQRAGDGIDGHPRRLTPGRVQDDDLDHGDGRRPPVPRVAGRLEVENGVPV